LPANIGEAVEIRQGFKVADATVCAGDSSEESVMRGLDPRIDQSSQESFEVDGLPGQARQ
jgi:hypothetical protein